MNIKHSTSIVVFALLILIPTCLITGCSPEKPQVDKVPAKPQIDKEIEKPQVESESNQVEKEANKEVSSQFLRIIRDSKNQPIALQAAIIRYVPKDRSKSTPTVDLISAVHIGEKNYYEELNREFAGYDVVLYELVAPEGTRVPKGGGKGSGSLISMIQKAMKDILELEFQLEMIDYTRENLVHADMSPAQFAESMNKRGDSMIKMFIRMMLSAMAQQDPNASAASDAQLLMALFDKNRAMALKRIMAEQFKSMDGMLSAIEGPNGSTLISDRNKIALDVLREQIDKGQKKIAIFYGGGHMPDFDKRLREQFELVPATTRWLVAWDLKNQAKPVENEKQPE